MLLAPLPALLTMASAPRAASEIGCGGRMGDRILLDWRTNRLSIIFGRLPGGKVEVFYLEAFCRGGSTRRKWEETVIPHKTVRPHDSGPSERLHLRTEVDGGVEVTHDIRALPDGVQFDLVLTNRGPSRADVDWLQPCIRVAGFTGANQETYVRKCFLFTDSGLKRLSDLPRAEDALYRGGQVYVPAGVAHEDVNPRPIASAVPANGLIGCFSADESMILATAWDHTQELFQGVITCIHSDPRVGGLDPGETKHLHGRIYLLPNEVRHLLRLYRAEFADAPRH